MNKGQIIEKFVSSLGFIFRRKDEIPIIYYHDIVDDKKAYSYMRTGISLFRSQMEYLKINGYIPILFNEIPEYFKKEKNQKSILITFDDGYVSNYDTVFPLMNYLNMKFNIFLICEKINNDKEFLTWQMIKDMSDSGVVGFGAHTNSHIDTRTIDENNFDFEFSQVNKIIEANISKSIEDFCFPFGYYNKKIIEDLCKKKIYKRLYTSDYKRAEAYNDCCSIGRIGITALDSEKTFKKKIYGLYNGMYYYQLLRNYIKTRLN